MIYDTVVIGGGPAGLAASIKAKELGLKVLLLDEKEYLGGILPQCIHPGFGLHYFKEDLTGPEFAHKLIEKFRSLNVEYITEATVLDISVEEELKRVKYVSPQGLEEVLTKSIIYASGARERHRFEIGIVGDRVAGVFTAGEAQTMMDIYGIMPGKEIVIVGSGDVGLIMARRFALEGAEVKAVIELMPYPGGLARNIIQCLQDFSIPLYLSHKVTEIRGKNRVESVKVVKVNDKLEPVEGTEFDIECDTVIISAGLVPRVKLLEKIGIDIDARTGGPVVDENLETSVRGIFVAGNSLIINDLVDYVVEQGELAAFSAKNYVDNNLPSSRKIKIKIEGNLRFVVPRYISGEKDVIFYARVKNPQENVTLRFRDIGYKIKYPVVKPSEMLKIRLPVKKIQKEIKELTLEVE
ncbi:Pyridine nucleotide-disulphide oxidoreductase, putative [Aciduliprofundum boonei T469]|nr:Pyridine nucleotide-disulphide oxidoreductase, putative [Aciduliprofundum boonei T469]